jgi:hypothetical protein
MLYLKTQRTMPAAEYRGKAENLDPEEKQAVQTVIKSYDKSIALMQGVVKKNR